jgi:hypothetical protein
MPATSHFVDGKNTLSQQQDTLNFMEQFTASKIISYGSSELTVNEAILLPNAVRPAATPAGTKSHRAG